MTLWPSEGHTEAQPFAGLPSRVGISGDEQSREAAFRARYASELESVVVHREVRDPRVSLIVVSYKAGEYLLDCLRHLKGQTRRGEVSYEIVLADSGGLEHLRDRTPELVDVDLRLRPGLPLNVARNAAMAWARGELVAYIDDDGLVDPDWVEQAVELFRDPAIGAARGRIVPHLHPYYNAFVVHYDRGLAVWDDESLGTEGNMVVRRSVYLAVDGFPDQFYGAEGSYLAFKIKQSFPHLRTVYAPRMVMRHDYCRSAREFVWKCRRYRSTRDDATKEDPAFRDFLAAFMRKPKPEVARPTDELVARRLMRAAQWAITRVSAFDRVARR